MTFDEAPGRFAKSPRRPVRFGFVPSNSSHVGKFLPLMEALRDRGDEVVLLDVDGAHREAYAARPQIASSGYPSVALDPGRFDPRLHWLRQAVRRRSIERAFEAVLLQSGAQALVFGFDSFVPGRAFVRTARRRGLPTVLLPDGLVVPSNPRYRPRRGAAIRDCLAEFIQEVLGAGGPRGRSGVDAILVMNAMGRDALEATGAPKDSIHVVGSPEYDSLAARLRLTDDAHEAEAVRARLGLDRRPVILFAHQSLDGWERVIVRTLVDAARSAGAIVLTKLHPRGTERADDWRRWAEGEGIAPGEAVFFDTQCTSIEALGVAAVCVTAYSTVCLEAFVCRRPVVLVQYANVPYALPYGARYGAALDAGSPEDLVAGVHAALADPDARARLEAGRSRAIDGEMGGLDGRSVERMLGVIDGLLARRAVS